MQSALIYLRVSTSDQANQGTEPDGFSIPAQRRACQRKAEQLDVVVTQEFVDRGESARTARRPGLKALLEALKSQRPAYVIVHKVDRLARNLHDDVTIRLAIRQAGAQLISVTENVDDTPSGQLMHGILASINEFYSGNLAAEALKGATEKARQVGTPYLAPLGYRNVIRRFEDRENRTVELDPERAPLVRWAFEAYATGDYSLSELCAELTRRGLRTRRTRLQSRPLGTSALARMLRSRYYLGFVAYNGHEYVGLHQPLVSPTTFAAVQLVQDSHRTGARRRTHHHALKGTLFCARCEGRMSFSFSKGSFEYFMCLNRHDRQQCDQPYIPVALAEAAVLDCYHGLNLSVGQHNHLVAAVKRELDSAHSQTRGQQQAQEARRSRLEREQVKLLEAFYAQLVDQDLFRQEQARIREELASIGTVEAELALTLAQQADTEARALELARSLQLADTFQAATPQVQRYLTRACFERIEIDDRGSAKRVGHGRYHDVVVARTTVRRTLNYQHLVYAILQLATLEPQGLGESPKM